MVHLRRRRALLVVVGALAVGCGDAEPMADRPTEPASPSPSGTVEASPLGQSYTNAEAGFTIEYPAGWTAEEVTDQSGVVVTIFARRSARDGFAENVNVLLEQLPPNVTLEQYTQANVTNLDRAFPDAMVIEEGDRNVGPYAGHWIHYEAEQQGRRVSLLQAWLVDGERAFVLSYTGEGDDFEEYRPDAEAILQSFRLS
jgi:eukaryotic-like serine/threonine-protein kinase